MISIGNQTKSAMVTICDFTGLPQQLPMSHIIIYDIRP